MRSALKLLRHEARYVYVCISINNFSCLQYYAMILFPIYIHFFMLQGPINSVRTVNGSNDMVYVLFFLKPSDTASFLLLFGHVIYSFFKLQMKLRTRNKMRCAKLMLILKRSHICLNVSLFAMYHTDIKIALSALIGSSPLSCFAAYVLILYRSTTK